MDKKIVILIVALTVIGFLAGYTMFSVQALQQEVQSQGMRTDWNGTDVIITDLGGEING